MTYWPAVPYASEQMDERARKIAMSKPEVPGEDKPARDVPRQLYELDCVLKRLEQLSLDLFARLEPVTRKADAEPDNPNVLRGDPRVYPPSTDVSRRISMVVDGLNRVCSDLCGQLDLLEL